MQLITFEETLDKIKQKGFWKIIIRPSKFMEKRIPDFKSCQEIIRDNKVLLRGWDYPHYDLGAKLISGDDYIQQSFFWLEYGHIEAWRYYQSGQFVHYLAMWEDWEVVSGKKYQAVNYKTLSFLSAIYSLTEIYEFASRLGNKGHLGDSCEIAITLFDTKDRILVSDPLRPLMENYSATIPEISYSISLMVNDLMANSDDHALNNAKHIFERFGWYDFEKDVFKLDQKKLREKKM